MKASLDKIHQRCNAVPTGVVYLKDKTKEKQEGGVHNKYT